MAKAHQGDRPDPAPDAPPATRRSFIATMAALIGPAAFAQDDAESRGKLTARLEAMRRLAKEVKVREITDGKPGPALTLRPEPLLRFTNPIRRVIDGTQWCWGERGRPPAVMKLRLWGPADGPKHWGFRVNVLSPKQVEVEFRDGETWSSRQTGLELRPLPGAPAPADSAAHRLIQAKDSARRLSASEQSPKRGPTQLRLLTRPIARYEDPTAGLLDGMLFSFVVTNNPIVLLVLEAWSEGEGVRTWRYAFASQGDGEQTALLDGKPDWSASSGRPPADTNLHVTRDMLADPAVQD